MRIFYVFCMVFVCSCTNLEDSFDIEDAGMEDSGTEDAGVVPIPKTQCNTVCKTNSDCDQWNGICVIINDGYQIRTMCTVDCNETKTCLEEGFFCLALAVSVTELKFNWQCLPIDGPICEGDE